MTRTCTCLLLALLALAKIGAVALPVALFYLGLFGVYTWFVPEADVRHIGLLAGTAAILTASTTVPTPATPDRRMPIRPSRAGYPTGGRRAGGNGWRRCAPIRAGPAAWHWRRSLCWRF